MKINQLLTIRVSIAISVVIAIWSLFFYYAIIEEINDETDDALENYSEWIITNKLSGQEIEKPGSTSQSQFEITELSNWTGDDTEKIQFIDSTMYIAIRKEIGPVRIMRTIFEDEKGDIFELSAYMSTIEKDDLIDAMFNWITILFTSLLLLIIVINITLLYLYMKPLRKLVKWLEDYRTGSKNDPLENETRIYEFKHLNNAAISYVKRTEEIFEQQKRFIGNASHEMRTPLASAMNRIELIVNQPGLNDELIKELLKVYETLEDGAKLNKTLLLLAKIENGEFLAKDNVDIAELIIKIQTNFEEIYSNLNINCEIKIKEKFLLDINREIITMLISNLLKNSYLHNIKGGIITIEVESGGFNIANSGNSGSLEGQPIFDRFYHNSENKNSWGIGLSIVEAICKTENLKCSYLYKNSIHIFEIKK